tara:strand:+ start:1043 stop:2032 length:990 start_codon:yes stop_codon:yes gene_type:complete
MNPDKRYQLLKRWVEKSINSSGIQIESINVDASFRSFFRFMDGGVSYVVMDSPPDKENNEQFILISEILEKMKIPSSRVLKKNLSMGFLLLNDLGPRTLLQKDLLEKSNRYNLYKETIDTLLLIQKNGIRYQDQLPLYDEGLLNDEMNLFLDWYCVKELEMDRRKIRESNLEKSFKHLSNRALNQKQVFVHRDFHSRNIIISDIGKIGVVDFQDAVLGPITYDLVSLLRDCYIEFPQKEIQYWLKQVYQQLKNEGIIDLTYGEFEIDFDLMGCQRHLKAIGIFSRLKHRDGKPNYMKDVPRTLNYLRKVSKKYDFLNPLHNFVTLTVSK